MNISDCPTSVDVTLYRYNHLDNRLWVQMKNELDYIEVSDDSIIVSYEQMLALLTVHYSDMVNKVKSVGADFLHKNVNSPYFIYMMLMDLKNLKYIKITKSYDKSFTRLLEIDGDKMLKFDFKILTMTIPLYEMYSIEELRIINPILEELRILEIDTPYTRIGLISLLDVIDIWINKEIDNDIEEGATDPIPLLTEFMDSIDLKTERDNPKVLLITDY